MPKEHNLHSNVRTRASVHMSVYVCVCVCVRVCVMFEKFVFINNDIVYLYAGIPNLVNYSSSEDEEEVSSTFALVLGIPAPSNCMYEGDIPSHILSPQEPNRDLETPPSSAPTSPPTAPSSPTPQGPRTPQGSRTRTTSESRHDVVDPGSPLTVPVISGEPVNSDLREDVMRGALTHRYIQFIEIGIAQPLLVFFVKTPT